MASKVGGMAKSRGWVPDQHGAWVMVTVPLLLGVWLAGPHLLHLPLAVAWYSGYFAFFAVSWWLRARGPRKRAYVPALVTYGAVCAVDSAIVIAIAPRALWWVAVFGPLMSVAIYEAYRRRPRSLLSGLSTVLASVAMIPLASHLVGADMDLRVRMATLLVGMYFCGTIFYVKSLIRERKNHQFGTASVLVHVFFVVIAAGVVALGWAHPAAAVVSALLAVRAWLMPWWGQRRETPWTPKFVGITEMLSTVLVVLTAVF